MPGDRPELFVMALVSSADVLVLDLRDAVAPAGKGEARDTIAQWCGEVTAQDRARLIVRINEAQSIDFADDLCLLRDARVAGVMLPKVESAAQVQAVRAALPDARVIASIQIAQGVAAAHEVACADGVVCLVFETLAYAVDLDIDLDIGLVGGADGLSHAAGVLAVASRVAGLPARVAGATPQLDKEHRLIEDLVWARRHGLGGKLCIHPRQVPLVHAVLAPGSVFAGEIRQWRDLRINGEWGDRSVNPYGMQAGTALAFELQQAVMRGRPFGAHVVGVPQSAELVDKVAGDPSGIGFAAAMRVRPEVRVLAVAEDEKAEPVAPTCESIVAGRYPLDRHLLIYLPRPITPLAREFVRFALSREGQHAVAASPQGYLPLSARDAAAELAKLG